jgi:hypothetical protein
MNVRLLVTSSLLVAIVLVAFVVLEASSSFNLFCCGPTITIIGTSSIISTRLRANGPVNILVTGVALGDGVVLPNCPGPRGCMRNVGSLVSVTAFASASNSSFSRWTITGASCVDGPKINPCKFTMPSNPGNVTVLANFTVANST